MQREENTPYLVAKLRTEVRVFTVVTEIEADLPRTKRTERPEASDDGSMLDSRVDIHPRTWVPTRYQHFHCSTATTDYTDSESIENYFSALIDHVVRPVSQYETVVRS